MMAWVLAAMLLLPLLWLSAEFLAAFLPDGHQDAPAEAPAFAVLMPAHDEVWGIAAAVKATRAQLRPCDRLVVIADNCTDGTAAAARRAGAFVATRTNPGHRGKGFALDFGRDILSDDPPEIAIILDADCTPGPGALQRLAAIARQEKAAVQGLFLLTPPAEAGSLIGISTFAFKIRNLVRQRGLLRLSGSAVLQGTGMAFPWELLKDAPLASASLVEDLQLGLELFLGGHRVIFDEGASFTSSASSEAATVGQRTRWEHGQISTAIRYVPRLLRATLQRPAALPLALDVAVPPLSLLGMSVASGLLGLLVYGWQSGILMPLLALSLGCVLFAVSLLAVWSRWGKELLPARTLAQIPFYMLWKLPIYGRLLVRPQRDWLRTSREP
ncbi:glycosyltransferase family 2 protein [Rhizorhapis sp.]|uniref:glycosyltransferase family 2 protein n=1 Tax=Rhizorhapis sp. TaxID=1968842 RepID=UPI002B48CECF|nr:glycosyltransferase family 2 protein [Rhizorhapis sp.]HKR16552.1 glycosyltransferase family 2 protein [Rhizorhapis sp.]